jgi:DNA-binding HxlR family transcriptional regulator
MGLKVRKNAAAPPACPLSDCMALLQGAWAPNVIWYLRAGPRRFGELRVDLPRVTAKILSARLRALETKGVLERTVRPTSPPSVEYALTPLGQQLLPAIESIVQVGLQLKRQGRQLAG